MPVRDGRSSKQQSSTSSSFLCCTSEKSGQAYQATSSSSTATAYREVQSSSSSSAQGQSKFLWLDPSRWVEKRTVKKETVGIIIKSDTCQHKDPPSP